MLCSPFLFIFSRQDSESRNLFCFQSVEECLAKEELLLEILGSCLLASRSVSTDFLLLLQLRASKIQLLKMSMPQHHCVMPVVGHVLCIQLSCVICCSDIHHCYNFCKNVCLFPCDM